MDIETKLQNELGERKAKIQNQLKLLAVTQIAGILPDDSLKAFAATEMYYKYAGVFRDKHQIAIKNGFSDLLKTGPRITMHKEPCDITFQGDGYHWFADVGNYTVISYVIFTDDFHIHRFSFKNIRQHRKTISDFLKQCEIPLKSILCIAEHTAYFCQTKPDSCEKGMYWCWLNESNYFGKELTPTPKLTFHIFPIVEKKWKNRIANKLHLLISENNEERFEQLCLMATQTLVDPVFSTMVRNGVPVEF